MTTGQTTSGRTAAAERDRRRARGWTVAVLAVPVVLAGTWVAGAVLTEDARVAQALTTAWFAAAAGAALLGVLVWGRAATPVLGAVVLTAGVVGGYLLLSTSVDRVADEAVLTAGSPAAGEPGGGAVVQVAAGAFTSGAHETTGTATLLERPDGSRVVTLTGFATDPGPDLRVYAVPAGADGVDGGVDLGALKGNRGDQQYDVPAGAPAGRVVVWCRAFSVEFGAADLA